MINCRRRVQIFKCLKCQKLVIRLYYEDDTNPTSGIFHAPGPQKLAGPPDHNIDQKMCSKHTQERIVD